MKNTNPTAALCMRITQHLADMPPAEKKLAALVLEYPGNLASHSASEITAMAGVSNAAMTRLVKRIGYDSYDQMRRLARDGIDWGSPLFLLDAPAARQAGGAEAVGEQLAAQLAASIGNIEDTFRAIGPADIAPIVQAIAQAPTVGVYGQRNSYFFAGYLRWQLIQFRPNVQLLPAAGETLAEHLAGFGAGDVVVLFGLRRRVGVTEHLVDTIHRQGGKTVLITDAGNAPDIGASWVLRCQTSSGMALDNHVAVMALCHVLCAKLIELAGSAGRKHLARIEELHARLGQL